MALSFEESKQRLHQQLATPSVMSMQNDDGIMTLESGDGIGMVAAYSEWTKSNKYDWYDDYSDDKISTVDKNKNILVDASQVNISQEENSQFIPFEMSRYYDGFDLMKATIWIYYLSSDGYVGASKAVNVSYDTATIKFGWLVDDAATHIAGNLKFEIRAIGTNSKGDAYIWKSKTFEKMNVLQSLIDDRTIDLSGSWVQELIEDVAESVADQIANAQIGEQVKSAEAAANRAENAASNASSAVNNALSNYYNKTEVDTAISNVEVDLTGYATEDYVKDQIDAIPDVDLSGYALKTEIPTNVSDFTNDAGYLTEHQSLAGLATETYVQDEIAKVDVSDQLADYAKSADVYTKTEVDTNNSNLSASISTNTESITSLNKAVESINQTLEGIDKSPRVTYEVTYGNVENDDGTTSEYMFTLWEKEGDQEATVKNSFQIMGGGGGSTSSVTLGIKYIEGYTSPIVATVNDSVIVKYEFIGEDSVGDTNLDAVASWKVGNRIVATQDVTTGECEFDLTNYVSTGDNKILLTIKHATGAVATKAWTIKVIDVRLESNFDGTKKNIANEPVNFTFTPYGGVDKTVHFLLDGKEIATKKSSASAAGLSDSYTIPAQAHGAYLFEIYMSADVNGYIESNHIIKDIIWYDENANIPVIGCVEQEFSIRQYEVKNIVYTVYDPRTETPSVNLRSTYVNDDGEVVEEFNSNLVLNVNKTI